jgi:hypothetical protein
MVGGFPKIRRQHRPRDMPLRYRKAFRTSRRKQSSTIVQMKEMRCSESVDGCGREVDMSLAGSFFDIFRIILRHSAPLRTGIERDKDIPMDAADRVRNIDDERVFPPVGLRLCLTSSCQHRTPVDSDTTVRIWGLEEPWLGVTLVRCSVGVTMQNEGRLRRLRSSQIR